jgi:hypothetical protein
MKSKKLSVIVMLLATGYADAALIDSATVYSFSEAPITVDILGSDSSIDNQIFWTADGGLTLNPVGIDNDASVTGFVVGSFAPGTRIDFGVTNQWGRFMNGPASGNPDGLVHAKMIDNFDNIILSFEDLPGGGDKDFNDAIFHVHGVTAQLSEGETPLPVPVPGALWLMSTALLGILSFPKRLRQCHV